MIRVAGILGLVVVALASWAGGANEPTEPKVVSRPPVPLNRQGTVLLDRDGKRLLLKAKVAARDRVLEMLCCLKQTKEHEQPTRMRTPTIRGQCSTKKCTTAMTTG